MASRTIHCVKLNIDAEGLDALPYTGELGVRIYRHISKAAWRQWIDRQTMLINEYHLNVRDTSARELLKKEMEKFLFNAG